MVDRVPIEALAERPRIEGAFWLLGAMVGRPVVQTRDGEAMVEVTDTGVPKRIGVRGFRTNVAQPPHVDNSFNHTPPDHVSLLCLRAAREGGASRFVSFHSVHNVLLAEHPEALERLYRPFYQDRQGDFWPDEPQTVFFPVFDLRPGSDLDLRCRYTHFTIPAGYETAGVEMDQETRAAFETMTRVVEDPALCCEFTLRPGELQFVNNRWCGHGRASYTDDPDPERKRLMLRLWHRDGGARPLPRLRSAPALARVLRRRGARPLDPSARTKERAGGPSTAQRARKCRPMSWRWTWLVPSQIWVILASRINRSTRKSLR